ARPARDAQGPGGRAGSGPAAGVFCATAAYPSHRLAPELLTRQLGTLGHCLELGPGNGGMDAGGESTLGEPTIHASNHVLPAHQPGISHNAFLHQLGVLDGVCGVCNDPRNEYLALGELDVFPHVILMFMARVGGLHRVGLRPDLQHEVDHVPQREIGHVGAVPATPADMVAYALLRNTPQGVVDQFHTLGRALAVLCHAEGGYVRIPLGRQPRVVDLQNEASLNDGLVLLVQRVCHGGEKRVFSRIEAVFALVKGRDSGHERLFYPDALEGFLEVLDVSCNRLPLVGDGAGADLRRGCDRLGLPVLVIKLRECVPVSSPRPGMLARPQRSRLKPREALVGVGVEAQLPLLAVADDGNATLHLLPDRLGHGAAHAGCQGLVVIGVAALSCPDHLLQVWRTDHAANMGGENTLCAALHSLLLLRSHPRRWCRQKSLPSAVSGLSLTGTGRGARRHLTDAPGPRLVLVGETPSRPLAPVLPRAGAV